MLGVLIAVMVPVRARSPISTRALWRITLSTATRTTSGNGNHGTVRAGLAPDRFGAPARAYLFGNDPSHGAQASDYIQIADSATLGPQGGITVAAWINTSNPEGRSIVGKQFGGGLEDSYLLWYNVGTLWFTLFPFGSASVNAPIPTLGTWHHVAGTWDGATIRLYVDGSQVASQVFAGPNQYDDSPVVIGADNDSADDVPDDGWDGLIDDVRIYNRALSQDELRELARGCTLELSPTYVGNTLHLNFQLGTANAATWNVWAVVQNTASRLWSVPIPVVDPPVSFDIPIANVPHVGVIGFLTATTAGGGIVCSDWETVDTGQ